MAKEGGFRPLLTLVISTDELWLWPSKLVQWADLTLSEPWELMRARWIESGHEGWAAVVDAAFAELAKENADEQT